APQLASQAPPLGMGGGGGDTELFAEQAPATEAASATEAPAAEPSAELLPMPTESLSTEDSGRIAETPAEKNGLSEESVAPDEPQDQAPFVPAAWQIVLAAIVVTGALLMILMRQSAINRWRIK
ncbi:MAG TPA: hypothetical protein VFZ43_04075, partial [Anaerolineales bacterium]